MPGVQTSLRAISAGTAQLPPIAPEPPEHLVGRNTVEALNNGAMFGTAAMLDGLADRVEAELGQPLTVVATGGLAPYIMPCCKRKILYDGDLLFKGLALNLGTEFLIFFTDLHFGGDTTWWCPPQSRI